VILTSVFEDEKNTREALDDDGWIHTGDVGEFDSSGRLKVIDRVKVSHGMRLK
jgi:long-chain acyl-CoA synthetase